MVPETTDETSGSAASVRLPGPAAGRGPAVVYFAKAPRAGAVKTRLCPPLTAAEAAGLYRGFLADVVRPIDGVRTLLFGWPGDALAEFDGVVDPRVERCAQVGDDLWQRMRHCFESLFAAGHDRVVLRNTDSPDLPAAIVAEALARCAPDTVVLGPDTGGGYYLVGLGAPAPAASLFGITPEGGASAFAATVAVANANGWNVAVLPEHRDVDDYADLLAVWQDRLRSAGQ